MKATYENNSEYSFIYIDIKSEKEADKAMRIANVLESYGCYELSHYDDEVFIVANTGCDQTIESMREDYREAKKAA